MRRLGHIWHARERRQLVRSCLYRNHEVSTLVMAILPYIFHSPVRIRAASILISANRIANAVLRKGGGQGDLVSG